MEDVEELSDTDKVSLISDIELPSSKDEKLLGGNL
jgi:hypothetical protein